MQRYNHLEKLKNMDDHQRKAPLIPDYIDQNFINDYFFKKMNSTSNDDILRKRQRRSKSLGVKRKTQIFEKKSPTRILARKRLTIKRKSLKL